MVFLKILLFVFTLGAAFFDLKSFRIPNLWIILFGALGFSVKCILYKGFAVRDFLFSSLAAVLILILPFLFSMMGAGDIKLFLVCGIYTGASNMLSLMLLSFLFAGIFSIVKALIKGNMRSGLIRLMDYVRTIALSGFSERSPYIEKADNEDRIPLAVFVFVSALLVKGGVFR